MAIPILEQVVVAEWRAVSHWTGRIFGRVIHTDFVQRSISCIDTGQNGSDSA
jgi:hypothetical protein